MKNLVYYSYLIIFFSAKRLSEVLSSPRQSIRNAAEGSLKKVLPGVVVTSSRSSRRRISSAAATQAFAVATSGESPKGSKPERLASNSGIFFYKYFLFFSFINIYNKKGLLLFQFNLQQLVIVLCH
jgi:hypothetical protein